MPDTRLSRLVAGKGRISIHGIDKYGFEAEEVEHITLDYLLSILTGNSPMIALLYPAVLYGGLEGFGHFVVIIGLEGDKIWYHDPDLKGELMSNVSETTAGTPKYNVLENRNIPTKREMRKVAELEMERLPFLYYGTKKELAEQKIKPVVI